MGGGNVWSGGLPHALNPDGRGGACNVGAGRSYAVGHPAPAAMTLVYSHPDPAVTHLVRGALEQIGVDAIVRGERPGAAMGEVPPVAAWSEVWASAADRHEEIEAVLRDLTAEPDADAEPWTCAACGETVEAHFGACWACGAAAPEPAL